MLRRQSPVGQAGKSVVYGCLPSGSFRTTFISAGVQDALGHGCDQFLRDPNLRLSLVHPEDLAALNAALSTAAGFGVSSATYRMRTATGQYRRFRDEMRLVGVQNGFQIVGSLMETGIVDASFELEKKVAATVRLPVPPSGKNSVDDGGEIQLQSVPQVSSMMIWVANADGGVEYVSKGWLAFTGTGNNQTSLGDGWLSLVHAEDRESSLQAFHRATADRRTLELEFRLLHRDGEYRWVVTRGMPRFDSRNKYIGHIGYCIDITHHRRLAEDLRAALAEKDILLKEIHHRVKNNLQVVCSILSLQSASVKEPWANEMFREAERRVKSMALIHEQLYMSDNVARLSLGDYLRRVVGQLQQCYRTVRNVTLSIEADEIFIPLDIAQPCGLIVHELVSNALKYAFLGRSSGSLHIAIKNNPANEVTLLVSDDGVGIPDSVDLENSGTLGLKLVRALTRQLAGTLTISRSVPTTFEVRFALTMV